MNKHRRPLAWRVAGALTTLLVGLLPFAPIASAKEVTWTGCGITKKAFMQEIAEAYEAKTGIKLIITGGGATRGIRTTSSGNVDVGGSCRHLLRKRDGSIHQLERNAALTPVAWDALVMITHPSNPVDNISLEQIKQIYQGKIISWKVLGGPDRPIILTTRDGRYSGVGHLFRLLLFQDPEYAYEARSLVFKSTGPLEKKIVRTPGSLGMDGISSARRVAVKILKVNGIEPTKANIASGRYPLFRPLYLVLNRTRESAQGRQVVDFVLSPAGQAIIAAQGTVNLQEGRALNALWNAQLDKMGL